LRQGSQNLADDDLLKLGRNWLSGGGQSSDGVGGELAERVQYRLTNRPVVRLVSPQRCPELRQRRFKRALECWPRSPGHPPICRRLQNGLDQSKAVTEPMQRVVSLSGRTKQWQPVAVGDHSATRRAESYARFARECDPESLPVEAAVK